MNYQVWHKDEFGDAFQKVDCPDIAAASIAIDKAVRAGGEPILTVEVPYSLAIKIEAVGMEGPTLTPVKRDPETKAKEAPKSEADKSKAGPGESTGAASQGQV